MAALDPGNGFGIAVSRDGTQLAYVEQAGGSSRIVLRRLDQSESKPVPGSEGGIRPIFSPDGRWLAYFSGAGGPIKKIAVTGGVPMTLCEGANPYGASWGDDDRIVFSGGSGTVLKQVPASGGKCELVSAVDVQNGETARRWPQILPGGASLLATISAGSSYDSARIAIIDRSSGKARVIVTGGSTPRYVSSGHLLYVRGATLYAVPFDLKRLSVAGPETPVVEGVYYNPSGGFADYAVSDAGMLLYFRETRSNSLPTLDWVERNGNSRRSALPPGRYAEAHMSSSASNIRLSPDGRRVAVSMTSGAGSIDIWIADLERGTLNRLTTEGVNYQPVWTPDGKRVAFSSSGRQARGIYWVPTDGSRKLEMLLPGNYIFPDAWTPDGKSLLYESNGPARLWEFTLPSAGGDGKPRMLSEQVTFEESGAQLSPDGRWMAYTSDESGRSQVYVRPFPGPGGREAISVEAGANPRWSANGREIFYFDPARNQVMVVAVEPGATLRPKQPQQLFDQRTADWDVTSDGKRFLVRRVPQTEQSQAKLEAVVNWFEELTRKVPPPR